MEEVGKHLKNSLYEWNLNALLLCVEHLQDFLLFEIVFLILMFV